MAKAKRSQLRPAAKRDHRPEGKQETSVDWSKRLDRAERLGARLSLESTSHPDIQRKVGFEFQCRKLKVKSWGEETIYDPKKGKQGAFLENDRDQWYLTSDGGDPEFVIDPPVEETDSKQLRATMRSIQKTASSLGKGKIRYQKKKINVEVTGKEEPVTADPQATIGIGYVGIGQLIDQLADRDPKGDSSEANKHLMQNKAVKHYTGDDLMLGKAKAEVSSAVHRERNARTRILLFDETFPSLINSKDSVVGVLTLVASYVIKAQQLSHAYIKDFPLLAKTDVGTIVQNSPFGAVRLDEDQMWWIFSTVSFKRKNIHEQMYNSKKLGSKDPKEDGPTVKEWVEGIFGNSHKDLLSNRENQDFADDSMGNMSRLDKVGPQKQDDAPIIELRRMTNTVPYTAWPALAERVRSWVARLNNPNSQNFDF